MTGYPAGPGPIAGAAGGPGLTLRIDGARPLAGPVVASLAAACDQAEDGGASTLLTVLVSGVPGPQWSSELTVALVSKWERALRRLERVPVLTVAVADGDCGGSALDALLAADYRIMPAGTRLVLPIVGGATWPGMALYRLARQAAGATLARRAVLSGTPIDAADARAAGIVDEVAASAALALARARELAGTAPGGEVAIRRQLMVEAVTTSFEEALGAHLAACDRALRSAAPGAG